MKFKRVILTVFAVSLTVASEATWAGELIFREGNNGTQDVVGRCYSGPSQKIDFKKTPGFKNDEARSLVLYSVQPGTRIIVYDNRKSSSRDDITYIDVKRKVRCLIIGSFERSYENRNVRVHCAGWNGLDGKVSDCEIRAVRDWWQ